MRRRIRCSILRPPGWRADRRSSKATTWEPLGKRILQPSRWFVLSDCSTFVNTALPAGWPDVSHRDALSPVALRNRWLSRALDDVADARLAVPGFEPHREAPQPPQMRDDLRRRLGKRPAATPVVAQRQRAIAVALVAKHLHVGDAHVLRVLLREQLAHAPVAALVMDAVDDELAFFRMVGDREQVEVAYEPRRQVLADERLVLEVAHREIERLVPVTAGNLGEPRAILVVGSLADAPQVGEQREPQRVRIESAVGLRIVRRLGNDVRVAFQHFEHEAVVDQALFMEPVEDRVMPERRPAFVHHLRLGLRIEIPRELADDANELALPRLELRRVLFDEIKDVLLRLRRKAFGRAAANLRIAFRQRAPEVVELPLAMRLPCRKPGGLGLQRGRRGAPV